MERGATRSKLSNGAPWSREVLYEEYEEYSTSIDVASKALVAWK
jgi:hypothetical protein